MKDSDILWFVMRDLTRHNSKLPAYKMLDEMKIENFTPKVQKLVVRNRKRERVDVPFIHDLLFVHDSRLTLDPIVEKVPTFQYRFLKGGMPMIVRDKEMEQFKKAVESSETSRFYLPQEVTPDMRKRKIRIIGGNLDGYEGFLVTVRGSKVKRLLVELPTLLVASIEVNPEYIQFL